MAPQPRLKAEVLLWGGSWGKGEVPAEVDPLHFAPSSGVPALMVNGRYDFSYPLENNRVLLSRLLGTPEKDKRRFVVDGGHAPLTQEVVRETLGWPDRYLEPVKTR